MYYKGEGVARNYGRALQWYKKSSQQGDARAQFNLARMYYKGEGVAVNTPLAYTLGLLASEADAGEDFADVARRAKESIKAIKPQLSQRQISAGERLAQEWRERIKSNKKDNK